MKSGLWFWRRRDDRQTSRASNHECIITFRQSNFATHQLRRQKEKEKKESQMHEKEDEQKLMKRKNFWSIERKK
jgi:hypothetical protein